MLAEPVPEAVGVVDPEADELTDVVEDGVLFAVVDVGDEVLDVDGGDVDVVEVDEGAADVPPPHALRLSAATVRTDAEPSIDVRRATP